MTADRDDPALRRAMELWAEEIPALPEDFAARVRAEAAGRTAMAVWAEDAVPKLPANFAAGVAARVARPTVIPMRRRWIWPTLAMAAAALFALIGPWSLSNPTQGIEGSDASPGAVAVRNSRAEVTHVEVFGAQSFAVISADEESEAKGNPPVVWITDDPDEAQEQQDDSETVQQ